MTDVICGSGILALLSGALAFVAFRLARKLPPIAHGAILAALTVGRVFYLCAWQDSLWFALILPLPSVPVLASLTLPIAGAIAGTLAATLPPSRRYSLSGNLLCAAFAQTARPFTGRVPATHIAAAIRGVVLQTSDPSYGAASAATLLQAHHLAATEPEMTALCLTRPDGIGMLATYRGLRLKTENAGFLVSPFTHGDIGTLSRVSIAVGLPRFSLKHIDPCYEADWGRTPGTKHAVVFFGQLPRGRIDIGDQSTGRDAWDRHALDAQWDGERIYLQSATRLVLSSQINVPYSPR